VRIAGWRRHRAGVGVVGRSLIAAAKRNHDVWSGRYPDDCAKDHSSPCCVVGRDGCCLCGWGMMDPRRRRWESTVRCVRGAAKGFYTAAEAA
jgi:hypothetical protein